jgi:hypothetical protein
LKYWYTFATGADGTNRANVAGANLSDTGSTRIDPVSHPHFGPGWTLNEAGDTWVSGTLIDYPNSNTPGTIAMWVRVNTVPVVTSSVFAGIFQLTPTNGTLVMQVRTTVGGEFRFTYGRDAATIQIFPATFAAGQVFHLVGGFDGGGGQAWLDGVSAGTAASAGTSNTAANIMQMLGAASNDLTIFDVRVWNRKLTSPEVRSLYDPATRWDLYYSKPVRRYRVAASGGTSITPPVGALSMAGVASRMDFGVLVPTEV